MLNEVAAASSTLPSSKIMRATTSTTMQRDGDFMINNEIVSAKKRRHALTNYASLRNALRKLMDYCDQRSVKAGSTLSRCERS